MTSDEFARRAKEKMGTLYRVCYALVPQHADREDAIQSALEKAFKKKDSLREPKYFETWLVRIVINECHNVTKRSSMFQLHADVPERQVPDTADPLLHDALMSLDEAQRLPIVLHYMEGYSVEEIAKMLKLPTGTIKSRMKRARERLRNILEVTQP